MLTVMIREQLRRQGTQLIVLIAIAAALPVFSVRAIFGEGIAVEAYMLLQSAGSASPAFPLLAIVAGVGIAVGAWQQDHDGGHIYALTLPLPRWHYALLRLAAGFALLLPVVIALGLSSTVVSAGIELPPGLHTYPWALTVRFFATVAVTYSSMFALASEGTRGASWASGGFFAIVAVDLLLRYQFDMEYSPIFNILFASPSPLAFFSGQWTLVDV